MTETVAGEEVRRGEGALVARVVVGGALASLVLALAFRFGLFSAAAWRAIRFPFDIDYGEGIVWQQALLIMRGEGYGDIARYPYVVFHYPPVYHALSWLTWTALGTDPLATGRTISVLAALVTAGIGGALVFCALREPYGRRVAAACAAIGALAIFSLRPFGWWAPLMRVDMLAAALGMLGILLALEAYSRPRWIHAASVCFVLALFTRQTAVSAPLATFAVLLVARPRLALAGIATCAVAGALALGWLSLATDGGFLQHTVLYNVNRFSAYVLGFVVLQTAAWHAFLVLMAVVATARIGRRVLRSTAGAGRLAAIREMLLRSEHDRTLLTLAAYFVVATPTLVTAGKSGASLNYFIEWLTVATLLAASQLQHAIALAFGTGDASRRHGSSLMLAVTPLLFLLQVVALPQPADTRRLEAQAPELRALVLEVKRAAAPVVSDHMALLLRADKEVPWEPAIFTELASVGRWDERPFIEMIRARRFAFFVTDGQRGDRLFDQRYSPAVAAAMDEAYPRKERRAFLFVHLPPAPAPSP